MPSSLHFCIVKGLFWKVNPRVVKIKKALSITKHLSYLQQAGHPAGKCTPGRGSSTQPEVRGPTSSLPEPGAACMPRAGSSWGTPEVKDLPHNPSLCPHSRKSVTVYLQVTQSLFRVECLFQVFSYMIQRTSTSHYSHV